MAKRGTPKRGDGRIAFFVPGRTPVLFAPPNLALARSLRVLVPKHIFAAALNLGRKALPAAVTIKHKIKAAPYRIQLGRVRSLWRSAKPRTAQLGGRSGAYGIKNS